MYGYQPARPPHFRPEGEPRHSLPETELVALLKEMGGTPDEFLDNPEFRQLLLPVVRADFQIHDQYQFEPAEPLPCPITAIGGESDSQVPFAAISEWREYSNAGFQQHQLPGGHFYLQEEGFLAWFRGQLG
nr:thioesterase domain-containing protein [Marinobacterium jannaschii]